MCRGWLLVLWVLVATGCSSTHFENTALQPGESNPDRRSIDPGGPDRPVILMSFSGGAARAAALHVAALGGGAATRHRPPPGRQCATVTGRWCPSVPRRPC